MPLFEVLPRTMDGNANTLTSPNPNAQRDLLLDAYRSAHIDPRNIGYMEAHGTGTPLGDPIETEGLKLVFKELYKDRGLDLPEVPHVRIGSAKTNIGHLEAAAGVAGVIKVIQSLKHKMIPGNPHLKTPNEYLKLKNTPLILQKETTSWEVNENRPRVAGVSSFGFGGANAHIILEEYHQELRQYQSHDPAIILLSAKNPDRLNAQVLNLIGYLETNDSVNLFDIAYTLQLGREALEERLSFVVTDIDELTSKLKIYQSGKRTSVFTGNIKKNSNDILLSGSAGKDYIETVIRDKELVSLAQLWVKGVVIDWNMLYSEENSPNKINLPVYPFARERYWITKSKTTGLSDGIGKPSSFITSEQFQYGRTKIHQYL